MKIIIKIFFAQFFLLSITASGQSMKSLKILKETEIKYYYVYKAIEFSENKNDTLFFLTSKPNNTIDSKYIKLEVGKSYKVETRLYSSVRISKDRYFFCKPGGNIFENDTISMKSLPILILEANEIKKKV